MGSSGPCVSDSVPDPNVPGQAEAAAGGAPRTKSQHVGCRKGSAGPWDLLLVGGEQDEAVLYSQNEICRCRGWKRVALGPWGPIPVHGAGRGGVRPMDRPYITHLAHMTKKLNTAILH